MVHLDRIGTPPETASLEGALVYGLGLPSTATQRLTSLGVELTDDPERLDDVAAVLVSTRAPRAEVTARLAAIGDRLRCPVVALTHTGGETTAVAIMRAGGTAIFAEGNEDALRGLLASDGDHDGGLIETYARHSGRAQARSGGSRGRDATTGLPDRSRFDERLTELAASGDVPRVAYIRVLHLQAAAEVLSPAGLGLLRRRLATQFNARVRQVDAELYALDDSDFGLIGETLTPNACEQLGVTLNRLATAYAPGGTGPLEIAVGHAGAEAGNDLNALKELAQRGIQVAQVDRSRVVIGPELLALGVSATTELEAATRIIDEIEQTHPAGPGHGTRVSRLAGELARELGYEGQERTAIELAGYLHHIGKIRLPSEARHQPENLTGEVLELYRTYPALGAGYLEPAAGEFVAAAVRHQEERWDGAGYPDGLEGNDIPTAARILAVAHAVEEVTQDGHIRLDRLSELAGNRLDPDMVRSAIPLIGQLRQAGRA